MSIVSVKIFNESDNYVANREAHFGDNFCELYNDLVVKKGVKFVEHQ